MAPFRRLLAVAWLVSLVQAGPAATAEWTLAADVAQRFQTDTNFRLDDSSQGALFGSTSTIDLRLGARTKRTRWNLAAGTRISVFAGPGDKTNLDGADPRANGGVFHQGKRFTADATFRFSRSSVTFTQFGGEDFDTITEEDATRTLLDLGGGITFMLDPLNQLSLSASNRIVRFSGDSGELEDNTSYGAIVSWAHDLTKRTTSALTFGISHFTADDAENTESLSFTATGGLDTQLTPRLTIGFDAGFNVADIERDPPERDDTAIGFNGRLQADYQLAADTQFSLVANQGFEPSSLGELQNRSTVGLSIRHSINSRSRLSLSATYSRQVSADNSNDTDRQLFALSPGYSIDLTPDWRASIGYTFRLRDRDSGHATSNNFFVGINRSFDLLR